jgi:transglutaminase-like putative cysteine protease
MYDEAVFTVNSEGVIEYHASSSDAEVQDLLFQSYFVPQDGSVSVKSISGGEIVFADENYFQISESFVDESIVYNAVLELEAAVQLNWLNSLELINDLNYTSEMSEYLAYDEFVNPTEGMESKASELVQGVKYKAEAVLRIVDFVHDYINYDLNVGGDYLLKASWVYENAVGTCDEYSVLAAALLRSIGVPVRFVHGYVKSERLGGYGPHSYLEVYLSGRWVPVDPTWGQYGFVDVSHINFLKSASPVFLMSSVSYKYRGASISAENPSINIVMDSSSAQEELLTLSGEFDRDKYYEDDYAVLTLTLTSERADPVIVPLVVVTTQTLEQVNPTRYVLLDKGSRIVRLVFKTPEVNPPGVIHPLIVEAPFSNALRFNVTNLDGAALSSYDDVKSYLSNADLVENPHVSATINFEDKFYGYSTTVNVTLVNDGNTVLKGLRVRVPSHSFTQEVPSISINKNRTIRVPLNYSKQGSREEIVSIYQDELLLQSFSFPNENVEVPDITLSADYNVSGNYYNLTVLLDSNVEPVISVLNISSGDYQSSTDFRESSSFLIPIDLAGTRIDLELTVVDSFGKKYSYPLTVGVRMSLWEKIIYYIKRFIKLLLYS